MSALSRIVRFLGRTDQGRPEPTPVTVPPWLLVPGLILLGASLLSYWQFLGDHPVNGADLNVYRGALDAFLHHQSVYRQVFTQYQFPYTYPPVSLLFLLPLALPDDASAVPVMTGIGLIALVATMWFTTRALGYRGAAGRIGLVAAVTAVMVWTEPVQSTFALGQVNILVMLPVVIDLSLSDRHRLKGIGIGVATAIKLLPGLFIVYLLVTRRVRAAAVAVATFVVLNIIGAVVEPQGTYDYWIRRLGFDSHRVMLALGPRYLGNQSLQGFTARLLGTDTQNTWPWMLSAAITAVAGLALAVWAYRRAGEALGMVVVAVTALLISPVSWSHHWVWIAPMVLVLGDLARRSSGWPRLVMAGAPLAAILPFLMWPLHAARGAPLLPNGIIWAAGMRHGLFGRIEADAYVIAAVALFVLVVWWLRRERSTEQTALVARS